MSKAKEYSLTANEHIVIRNSDGACIPDDPANADYQAFLAFKKAGGVPEPAPTLPPVAPPPDPMKTLEALERRVAALEKQLAKK